MQYDFTKFQATSVVIETEIPLYAYGTFGNVNRSFVEPTLSNTIYEAFIGASMSTFTKIDGVLQDIVDVHGAILTTQFDGASCT